MTITLEKAELLYLRKEFNTFKRDLEYNIRYAKDNFANWPRKVAEVKEAEKELSLITSILKKLNKSDR